jgi:two-component system phosphate regulon response regulator PhoB
MNAMTTAASPKTCIPFPKTRVLVVEDEPDIAKLISVNLNYSGFQTVLAADGAAAAREMAAILPDVILLDWMLPGQSGLELAKQWRAQGRTKDVPILMLTAKGEEHDKVVGLESGVDDYITKPFSPRELVARIRAVLRRRAPERIDDCVSIGKLTLDAGQHAVTFAQQELKPGPTEFRLLHYLMKHPGRVHSREQLLDKVWGDHVFIEERTVDVHIKRLRQALGAAGAMVETVRGAGYRLVTTGEIPEKTPELSQSAPSAQNTQKSDK